ncbi:MAG: DEAD/DEAH box helicase, partial [Bacteroides heparinolyticus]|nr:DEAD/DEAH box helicase [Bacteroides heparinolyticus]
MSKYDQLLSIDPIGALDKIKDNYYRYFDTMYRFRDEDLEQRKHEALVNPNDKVACRDPYIELCPEYQSTGRTLAENINDDDQLRAQIDPEFADFIMCGLMDYPPYVHQIEMLKKAVCGEEREGQTERVHNTIITSGTGSGKTESFMLPLLSSLFSEAKTWDTAPDYDQNWLQGRNGNLRTTYNQAFQRQGENRPAAIRALIMYPMNALVADQVARLRKALDSDSVRNFLDNHLAHNNNNPSHRIFFGQYNGETIGGGKTIDDYNVLEKEQAFRKVADQIKKIVNGYSSLCTYIRDKKAVADNAIGTPQESESNAAYNKAKAAEYIAPRLKTGKITAEMITRWDMQEYPPDILITNYSMLSIMMMRHTESEMIRKTKDWFSAPGHPERVFHLVIDELHLYRNTSGTEIAYLIRQFLESIGVPPTIPKDGQRIPNPKLRILASSASLGDDQATEDFARQFFGVYYTDANGNEDTVTKAFNIVKGESYTPQYLQEGYNHLSYEDFAVFADPDNHYIDLPDDEKTHIMNDFLQKYVTAQNGMSLEESFLAKYAGQIFCDIKLAMQNKENPVSEVPIDLLDLERDLNCSHLALRGFFIFRADKRINKLASKYPLPRFRFHQFYRYIDGLWGELDPNSNNGVIGKMMYRPTHLHNEHKVLELLRCECCGELFIGGNTIRENKIMSLNCPNLDVIPNRNPTPMVQSKKYGEYAIFWPQQHDQSLSSEININNATIDNAGNSGALGDIRWEEAWLNSYDGRWSQIVQRPEGGGWIEGYIYTITGDGSRCLALPPVCPHCAKDYRKREHVFSPIRNFRTGIKRNNQVLSKELIYQLPENDRKLIGFSDSRQDAAEQAKGIALEHYRDMVRLSFMQCVEDYLADNHDSDELTNIKQDICDNGFDRNGILRFMLPRLNGAEHTAVSNILNSELSPTDMEAAILSYHNTISSIPLSNFVTIAQINQQGWLRPSGNLVEKLLSLGINPAGTAKDDQKIGQAHWSSHFYGAAALPEYREQEVNAQLKAAVFRNSFGQFMGVSAEETGLGYITYDFDIQDQNVINLQNELDRLNSGRSAQEFLSAAIRVMGDAYRYYDPEGFGDQDRQNTNCVYILTRGEDVNVNGRNERVIKSVRLCVQHFLMHYNQQNTVIVNEINAFIDYVRGALRSARYQ